MRQKSTYDESGQPLFSVTSGNVVRDTGPVAGLFDRRGFLKSAALPCLTASAAGFISRPFPVLADSDAQFVREADFYERLSFKKIRCKLCPRECTIDDQERGYCGVRENRGGTYYTLVYSRVAAAHIDPIEKKPFFHFYPGSLAFSFATAGCNVNCKMCQNWEISQSRPEQVKSIYLPPRELAAQARKSNCLSIAYTYSEPAIFYEYMVETADAGREQGVKSAVVTGGYIQQEPLKKLCRHVDAVKVDLKSYSTKFYKEVVNGELKPVLDTIVTLKERGMWTEVVYLVVPTLNDSDQEFQGLARWFKSQLGVDVPLHFSCFHPQYLLMNLPPTPIKTLERAKAIADAEGIRYVYIGNVPGHPAENTYCPQCRRAVVERAGFLVTEMRLKKGKCPFCQQAIAGVWPN